MRLRGQIYIVLVSKIVNLVGSSIIVRTCLLSIPAAELITSSVRRNKAHWEYQKRVHVTTHSPFCFTKAVFVSIIFCKRYLMGSISHVPDRNVFRACCSSYDYRPCRALSTPICAQHDYVDGGCIVYAHSRGSVGFYHYRYGLTSWGQILINKSYPFLLLNTFVDYLFRTCVYAIGRSISMLSSRL